MKKPTLLLGFILVLVFLPLINPNISFSISNSIDSTNNTANHISNTDIIDIPRNSDDGIYEIADQWILNQTSQQQILWNNQTLENYAQQLIDSFDLGNWKDNYFTPTIRSTYHAIRSLDMSEKISLINASKVTNFVLNRYNESSGLFSDVMCGLLSYSTPIQKIGYSDIEATAYSILILYLLDSLDLLTSTQLTDVVYALRSAINGEDGGFCHSSTGIPNTEYEGSSLLLSYYCYSALQILRSEYPISTDQQESLALFVSARQNMNTGDLSTYGGYMESDYSIITTIESTYYAVKLLEALDRLEEISSTALIHHLEALKHSNTGGVFNTFHPSKTLMPQPEFFSSSLVLDIIQITGIGADIDTNKCYTYIEQGFDTETHSWYVFNRSSVQYLKDQMLILEGLTSVGLVNTSIGIENFIFHHCVNLFSEDRYELSFAPIPRSLGSITGLYQKITFLEEMGRLDDLNYSHKNAIMAYIDTLASSNTFTDIPGFDPNVVEYRRVFDCGLELSVLPYNISQGQVFGMGIHHTSAVLQICELLGTLTELNGSNSFHTLASEILNCQDSSGSFKPHTNALLGTYDSVLLVLDAVRCLAIIDSFLGTSYLDSINDSTLENWLLSQAVFNGNHLFFEDGNPDSVSIAQTSIYVWQIDLIANLSIFSTSNLSKLKNWIENHPDLPLQENNFSPKSSFWVIFLHSMIVGTPVQIYIPRLLTIIRDFLGENSSQHFGMFVSAHQFEMMRYCSRDWFSTTMFASLPDIQVGYTMRFDLMSSGFSHLNYEFHNLTVILPDSDNCSSNVIGTSHIVQFQKNCILPWYPNITIQIQDDYLDTRLRVCNFTLRTHLLYVVDVTNIPTLPKLSAQTTLSFSLALFLNPRTGSGSKPINCTSSFTIQNETTDILSNIGTIIDGKYIIMVSINTTVLEPDEYYIQIVLTHDIFQYEPGYIGNTNNLSRTQSSIRILSSFIIDGEKPKTWRSAALGGIVSISGLSFGFTGYVVCRNVIQNPTSRGIKQGKKGKTRRKFSFKKSARLFWGNLTVKMNNFLTTSITKIKDSTQIVVQRIQTIIPKKKIKNRFITQKPRSPFFIDENLINPSFLREKPNPVKKLFDKKNKRSY